MHRKHILFTLVVSVLGTVGPDYCCAANEPKLVRDLIWVWGNPEMAEPGAHTSATYAQASPAQRAQILGATNIIMAGHGLPSDDQLADRLTRDVLGLERIVWEIAADGNGGPPFVYMKRMAQVRTLVDKYPKIQAVVLDDMSTVGIDRGFKPEHIRQIRALLPGAYRRVQIWGVVYTMSLNRAGISDYIEELDVILLAEWHAKNVVNLEKNVAYCERLFPDRPIVLGLYLFDYGGGRRIPRDLLAKQCETALRLVHAGRIEGIELTTINNDPEAVGWAADWIRRVGDQKLRYHAGTRSLNVDKFYECVSLEGLSCEVWSERAYGTKHWPSAGSRIEVKGGHLRVPILNGIRRNATDGAFYVIGNDVSFDEFRRRLVKSQIGE